MQKIFAVIEMFFGCVLLASVPGVPLGMWLYDIPFEDMLLLALKMIAFMGLSCIALIFGFGLIGEARRGW